MRKIFYTAVAVIIASLGATASDNITVGKAEAQVVSLSRNMQARCEVASTERRAPMKGVATHAKKHKGLKAVKTLSAQRVESPSAALFESFESCKHLGNEMPEGWTSHSNVSPALEGEENWIGLSKAYADFFMYAPPAHGNMAVGVFYNDDIAKDEWLISPSVEVPSDDYELQFYWYTTPLFFYVIDRMHVDYENGVFSDREITSDIQVLARVDGGEWEVIYDLEKQFANVEYAELAETDYDEMQYASVSLAPYVGRSVQFAFRYFGIEGNTFVLDAVSVDKPRVEAHYTPHYSRLFFGYTPDENIAWHNQSIEFYPVNHPIYWENTSPTTKNIDFSWSYYTVDENGKLVENTTNDDADMLALMYAPDYSSEATLMNNFYPMPTLNAQAKQGGSGSYTHPSSFLQAGGRPEFDFGEDDLGHTNFVALPFSLPVEGYCAHYEEDESLGFYAEPIFGYSANTDAWWEHYSYPNGKPADDVYAYVDGFANLYLPHPTATLVVNGVTAWAYGTIYPEAEFTMNIYTMTEDGFLIEQPIASKTIRGEDVTEVSSGMTHPYLIMNFPLDKPVEFNAEGTEYGYIVEINGYHDEKISFFAPMQSLEPNEYEWCLGFYRYRSPFYDNITDEMSYLAYFKDFKGRDLYSSFAIGLDAHYPWLELAPGVTNQIVISDETPSFPIRGYFDASRYSIMAPDWLDVELSGRYNITARVTPRVSSDEDRNAKVTISAPGVDDLSVNLTVKGGMNGIDGISASPECSSPVYSLQGIMLRPDSTPESLRSLPAGIYIINGKKLYIK